MRLAKIGYYNGDPEAVKNAPVDVILDLINYESFESKLEQAYRDLNTGANNV